MMHIHTTGATSRHVNIAHSDYDILAAVLAEHKMLSWRGWWNSYRSPQDTKTRLKRDRSEMLEDGVNFGLPCFQRAMAFLAIAPRTASVNREFGAYYWKHKAERWYSPDYAEPNYVGTGTFIAAAYASGLIVERAGKDTLFNLSDLAASMPKRGAL